MKTNLFTIERAGQRLRPDSLAAHLIDVATRWSSGESSMKIISIDAFRLLMIRERYWFCKDHRVAETDVEIQAGKDEAGRGMLMITAAGRCQPAAVIRAMTLLS